MGGGDPHPSVYGRFPKTGFWHLRLEDNTCYPTYSDGKDKDTPLASLAREVRWCRPSVSLRISGKESRTGSSPDRC